MRTHTNPELSQIQIVGTTRAVFLARATLAAGAIIGAGALTPFVSGALAQDAREDADVLNFALTLEYLEAAFYKEALKEVPGLSREVRRLAEELRNNEAEHVAALAAALESVGAKPDKEPRVTFGGAFADESTFLRFANVFEDTGVSAYNGAATRIKSKGVLRAAGAIVQVEARHAALIRLQRNKPPAPLAFDRPSSQKAVKRAIQPFFGS